MNDFKVTIAPDGAVMVYWPSGADHGNDAAILQRGSIAAETLKVIFKAIEGGQR